MWCVGGMGRYSPCLLTSFESSFEVDVLELGKALTW